MATGDTYTNLGTTFKVAVGKPATEDQTGYGALTWTEVGGVVSLPERGDSVEDVSEPVLKDGRIEHFIGAKDGGVIDIPVKFIEGDAGQAALASGAGTDTVHSFQEVDTDGEAHFYYGRIMSYMTREATANSFKGRTAKIAINSGRTTGTEES
jgi:hypothetical protein